MPTETHLLLATLLVPLLGAAGCSPGPTPVPCDVGALIAAIDTANASPDPDVIELDTGCDYVLPGPADYADGSNGLPSITSPVTLTGDGATILREDDDPDLFRILHVGAGGELVLSGVTLQGGHAHAIEADSPALHGGCLYNAGAATLVDVTMQGCFAPMHGGAAYHTGSGLEVEGSSFLDDEAAGQGGALHLGGPTTVSGSTFVGNSAVWGGGVWFLGAGSLSIESSVFEDNTASGNGGAARLAGPSTITGTSFFGNQSVTGGAVSMYGYQIDVADSTFSGNHATSTGGGVFGASPAIRHSIVASNTADAGNGDCELLSPPAVSGDNLGSDGTCTGFTLSGDPLLGPLQDNGGPTLTHLPAPGSAVVDYASDCTDTAGNFVATDQRGLPRPDGGSCDLGAVEGSGPGPEPEPEPAEEVWRLCVANENGAGGVACFDEAGAFQARYDATTDAAPAVLGSAGGLAVLDGGLFVSTNERIARLDLASGDLLTWATSYDVAANNVNALGVYDGLLVAVGSAGGWVHQLQADGDPVEPPLISGLESPQGFANGTDGVAYVVDRYQVRSLTPADVGGFETGVLHDLRDVDPGHFSEGTLAFHDGHVFYTQHGPDGAAGHVVAVAAADGAVTVVAEVPDNPRGLTVDPAGEYLYVSRLTAASVDRIPLATALSAPVVEPFVSASPELDGPFGLAWAAFAAE